jgi:dTDP-4-dehydrorhamnose reductase
MVTVLVTGANGQLGQALQAAAPEYPGMQLIFCTSAELDITDPASVDRAFERHMPQYCINSAAYTAVDKAESDAARAYDVNVTGTGNLASAAERHGVTLLHVSTDFVFDGKKQTPYTETDETRPTGVYGRTKREGEMLLAQILHRHYIVRTSWVYSEYGHNFMKTMLRLASERDTLSVVDDQTGTPTNANDLARALLTMIGKDTDKSVVQAYGTYHFSNEGQCSWFDFAAAIFAANDIKVDLRPIPTSAYPTPARRPAFSVLNKTKIRTVFGLEPSTWQAALAVTVR